MHHGKRKQKVGQQRLRQAAWRRLAWMGFLSLTLVFLAAGCRLSSRPGAESSDDLGGDALRLRAAAQRMGHEPAPADPRGRLSDDARANVARIEEIWADCHARYGKQGPFLFGAFSGADAMYAPVVHRFRTYAIPVKPAAQHYVDAMMQLSGVSAMDPRRPGRDAADRAIRGRLTGPCAAEL